MLLEEACFLGCAEVGEMLAIDHPRNLGQPPSRGQVEDRVAEGDNGPVNHALPPARPRQKFTEDGLRMREVLSYSRRGGRFTPSQQESWDAHHRDWVIPDEAVDDPSFSWAEAFGRTAPIVVEIGSGIGEATAALAAGRPSYDIVALEVWRPGVAHTLGLLAEAGADNVRLLVGRRRVVPRAPLRPLARSRSCGRSSRTRGRRSGTTSVAWSTPSSVRSQPLASAPVELWRLATDWADYARKIQAVLDAVPGLEGGPVERWQDRPVTKFERKGRSADRQIIDLAYRRV